jgi:hypothetical protein
MTTRFRARQAWTIATLEVRRAFFSKRAFWVYLLALFPAVIFIGHGLSMKYQQQRFDLRGAVSPAALDSIKPGMTGQEVQAALGKPQEDYEYTRRRRDGSDDEAEETRSGKRVVTETVTRHRHLMYWDGGRRADFRFVNGVLQDARIRQMRNFSEDRAIFAGVFQFFYLRLAIFFGCLGIFMNLFRGEMLDKTLHFWFLAPARREVLLAGKYLAGLVASSVIFTGGAILCFFAVLWPHSAAEVQAYWQGPGLEHVLRYALAAAMGCAGYGSVFLAAGLLLRNPIIPAAVLLVWEGINGFLPDILQKLSVLYYLQSMCPVPAPLDSGTPALLRLILAPAAPASVWIAVPGLLAVTALVLWAAAKAVKRLEINYSTE